MPCVCVSMRVCSEGRRGGVERGRRGGERERERDTNIMGGERRDSTDRDVEGDRERLGEEGRVRKGASEREGKETC